MTDASISNNPVVRIVAANTSPMQPDSIPARRVKLHARDGSLSVDAVDNLLEDAVSNGELEKSKDNYRIAE